MSVSTELILSKARQSTFWSLIRSTPISLLGALTLINIIYPTEPNLIFLILYLVTFGSNAIFKYIAQLIYRWLGTDYIPFIGQGTRPSGAYGCSSFISVPLIPATSFGMPSGHSQLAWFFAVYACLSIINLPLASYKFSNISNFAWSNIKSKKVMSCIALIALAAIISYSRVSIEGCHTTGQVVIGGMIGSIMAIVGWGAIKWLSA
jgi:membrane-associated phospholipid phosphatase